MENCEHHFLELVSRFFYEGNSVFPSSFSGLFVSYPIFSVRAETLKGARFAWSFLGIDLPYGIQRGRW